MPTPSDVAVVCTNLREMNGKRPVFADSIDSVFVFPLMHIRFIEIAAGTIVQTPDVQSDEDRLRLPTGTALEPSPARTEPDEDLEIDEDFLRRVRDV